MDNGGMQKSRSNDGDNGMLPMMLGGNPATVPPGGNNTLINMNEAEVLDTTIEDSPYCCAPAGYNEDDSHVVGIYRETDFAGS